jgi:hypothetical protein
VAEEVVALRRGELAPPRARLTRRAVVWATDALAKDDTTVSGVGT